MCKATAWERNLKGKKPNVPSSRIDKCILRLVAAINQNPFMVTLSSCCGHGVYPLTIIVKEYDQYTSESTIRELLSGKVIRGRTERFYKADVKGRYYVPEVSEAKD